MKIYRLIPIVILFAACSTSEQEPNIDPSEEDAPASDGDIVAQPSETPSPAPPAKQYNACEMLLVEEITAANFSEFDVGSPIEGTDPFVFLGEAVSCKWEVGDPSAQFHHVLDLSIILLIPGGDPVAAFEAQAARLIRTEDISGAGERAVIDGRSETILVLDGDFLFFLGVNFGSIAEGTVDEMLRLANLVISRN